MPGAETEERAVAPPDSGVEANQRLTASTAVVLFVLLFVEGVTVLRVRSLIRPHVLVGMLLVPPILVKIGSTFYRFLRYYTGAPAYRAKGPPAWVLRILGPVVVVLTVIMFGSGIALLLAPASWHASLLGLHKVSFILWFLATTVHVLGHLGETVRFGLPDWVRSRWSPPLRRATNVRRAVLLASLAVGAVLGVLLLTQVATYLGSAPAHLKG